MLQQQLNGKLNVKDECDELPDACRLLSLRYSKMMLVTVTI